jgi:hypothetical protein
MLTESRPDAHTSANGARARVRDATSDDVGVLRAGGEYRLVAIRPIAANQRLFHVEGDETRHPTRHSLQIGRDRHLDLAPGRTTEELLDYFFWRYLNHHCEPNSMIRDCEVITLRAIEPWENVTFNYNTTEYDMAEPFACNCGSAVCARVIQGARHMPDAEYQRLRPLIVRTGREDLLRPDDVAERIY